MKCEHRGEQYVQWKCKYCCRPAVYHCFGTTHFCERCHNDGRLTCLNGRMPKRGHPCETDTCEGGPLCPLGCWHTPHGQEFCLGCAVCRQPLTADEEERAAAGKADRFLLGKHFAALARGVRRAREAEIGVDEELLWLVGLEPDEAAA